MVYLSKVEVRLWTIVGLIHTTCEVIINNEKDVRRVLADLKDFRESQHFVFFCNFFIVRLYLLTYIVLVYPVFVEKFKMLITPWLVVSGVRVLEPLAAYRIYFWILIFRYWMKLIDIEIRELYDGEMSEKKMKYLQSLDKDEEFIIRETRRKIKGIKLQNMKFDESGLNVLTPSGINMRPSEKSVVIETSNSPNNSVNGSVQSLCGDSGSSSYDFEKEFNKPYYFVKRLTPLDKTSPVRVTDCIVQQITDLIETLVSRPQEQLLAECLEGEQEMKKKMDLKYIPPILDAAIEMIKYNKPHYLIEYPNIFDRSLSYESTNSKFERMLLKKSDSDDTLRQKVEEIYQTR